MLPRGAALRPWAVLLAAALAIPSPTSATTIEKTEAALRILLAASSLPVPSSSPSCHSILSGVPRPTIGDHLATPLSGLDRGANRVSGACDRGRCRVRITHRAGEDVFSYEYRFRTEQGRLVPDSLECFSTP